MHIIYFDIKRIKYVNKLMYTCSLTMHRFNLKPTQPLIYQTNTLWDLQKHVVIITCINVNNITLGDNIINQQMF